MQFRNKNVGLTERLIKPKTSPIVNTMMTGDSSPHMSEFGQTGFNTQRGSLEHPNFNNLQSFDRSQNRPIAKRIHTQATAGAMNGFQNTSFDKSNFGQSFQKPRLVSKKTSDFDQAKLSIVSRKQPHMQTSVPSAPHYISLLEKSLKRKSCNECGGFNVKGHVHT